MKAGVSGVRVMGVAREPKPEAALAALEPIKARKQKQKEI